MNTDCKQISFGFQVLNRRKVEAQFNCGRITSDAGGLLLRELENCLKIIDQFSKCFKDYRNQDLIEHKVPELIAQRVY